MNGHDERSNRGDPRRLPFASGLGVALSLALICTIQFVLAARILGGQNLAAGSGRLADQIHHAKLQAYHNARGGQRCIDWSTNAGEIIYPIADPRGRLLSWFATDDTVSAPALERALTVAAILGPILLTAATALLVGSERLGLICSVGLMACVMSWLHAPANCLTQSCTEALLFGPAATLHLAALYRYHHRPGALPWLALTVASALGWSLFPLPWLAFAVVAALVWLALAHRHDLSWHGLLILALVTGAVPFVSNWVELVEQRALHGDQALNVIADALPPIGTGNEPLWTLIGLLATSAALPWIAQWTKSILTVTLAAPMLTAVVIAGTMPEGDFHRLRTQSPWGADTTAQTLSEADTTPLRATARLLCELPANAHDSMFLNLRERLPILAVAKRCDDGLPWAFGNGILAGRPIGEWSDDELAQLFERWNIGWVCTSSSVSRQRLGKYSHAAIITRGSNDSANSLFAINRDHRFVLRGRGQCSFVSHNQVVLSNLVPEQGEVLLSLRYHPGLSAGPGRLAVEPETDPYDPFPLIRIKLDRPMSRLILRADEN